MTVDQETEKQYLALWGRFCEKRKRTTDLNLVDVSELARDAGLKITESDIKQEDIGRFHRMDAFVIRTEQHRFLEALDEYILMLSIFRDFGRNHLFARTSNFSGPHNLNRNGILHGKGEFVAVGRQENFLRLWSTIDFIAFALAMGTAGVSALAPNLTPEARRLASRLETLTSLGELLR